MMKSFVLKTPQSFGDGRDGFGSFLIIAYWKEMAGWSGVPAF